MEIPLEMCANLLANNKKHLQDVLHQVPKIVDQIFIQLNEMQINLLS